MRYRSSILMFGGAIPALIMIPLAAGLTIGSQNFRQVALARKRTFNTYMANVGVIKELGAKITPKMPVLDWQRDLAGGDQYTKIGDILSRVESEASAVLRKEKFRKETTAHAFSPEIKQSSEQYNIGFAGRFGAIEGAALTLETHRPNMLLTAMTITAPDRTKPEELLTADSTYIVLTDNQ